MFVTVVAAVTAVVDAAVLFTITVEAAVGVVEVERSFFHIFNSEASDSSYSLQLDDSSYSTMINQVIHELY